MARGRSAPAGAPVSLLADVRGFSRDFAIDALPAGFLWDVCDFVLNRRGLRLAYRAGYVNKGLAFPAASTGGLHAAYQAGAKLIMESAGSLYDVSMSDGSRTSIASPGFSLLQNGTLLRNRAYFFGATAGAALPWYVTWSGSWSGAAIHASGPKGTIGITYKDRLVVAGTGNMVVYFSPLETDGGPLGAWDAKSQIGTSNKVNGLAAMATQILVFHDGSIERIRGAEAPSTGIEGDMFLDTLSEHVGCPYPASICHWQENVVFADPNGVQMTDGASIRCLTDQGGLHSYWSDLYRNIRPGAQVRCEVFQDQLIVFVPTTFSSSDPNRADFPTLLICDLSNRTWSRFSNVYPSCLVPIIVGAADVAWCGDGYGGSVGMDGETAGRAITPSPLKLSFVAPMFMPPDAKDPNAPLALVQQYDGDGDPVLPHLETGWARIGGDEPKQFVDLYVAHVLQVDAAISKTTPVLQASFTVEPLVGYMPGNAALSMVPGLFYTRDRFDLDDSGYGVRIALDAVSPVGVGGIFDVQVKATQKDPGSLR